MIKKVDEGIVVSLRISPNAKKNEIIKENDTVKVKITAQPVDGKANKALLEFLSKTFKIPKTSVKIIKGETSKDKALLFQITDIEKLKKLYEVFEI